MSYGDRSTIITRAGADPETYGFDTDADLNDFVDGLIDRSSGRVEDYCDRQFGLVQNHTDRLTGNGRETITTRHYPVVTVHAVTEGGRTLTEDEDYRLEQSPGRQNRNSGRLVRLDRGRKGRRRWRNGAEISVEYDWGFESPPGTVRSVVEDMVVAVLQDAAADRQADGKTSESMDGYSVSWDVSSAADRLQLTEAMRERLDPVRRQATA